MLLEVKNLDAAYGDVQVLWDINFQVQEKSIVAIVGSNGAGKTTLLRVISGIMQPKSGEIVYNSKSIGTLGSSEIVKMGIVHVPEGRKLFPDMTVEENLIMGSYHLKDKNIINKNLEFVYDLFPRLAERKKQKAGSMSGGEQQMAAIGRGLMASPKLFLIDEMSLGLAPLIVDNLVDVVTEINKRGTTVLLVEQDVQLALEHSHYGYVLDTGRVVMEGKSEKLLNDPKIKEVYLGL